jgi:uncharacterized protein (TIGR00106 family)
MLFSVSMFPIGSSDDLSQPVAEVVDEISKAHLPYRVSAMDTVIEGEWDTVMPVLRKAYRRMAATHDRVYVTITMDEHRGGTARLDGAVEDVSRQLGHPVPA